MSDSVYINDMTDLLDRIEDRIGMVLINLPPKIAKPTWSKVIIRDSLTSFSRFFPHKITIPITISGPKARTHGGWYLVTDFLPKGIKFMGVGDIDWKHFGHYAGAEQSMGYGAYDFLSNNFGLDDVGMLQMRADHMSIFDNSIYVIKERPNKVRFETVNGRDITKYLHIIPLEIFVKNYDNLSTISPTMMETFDDLATADVAIHLYNQLKFFDGLETIFSNVELKMDELKEYANMRRDVIQTLKDNSVSSGNKAHRFMVCQ